MRIYLETTKDTIDQLISQCCKYSTFVNGDLVTVIGEKMNITHSRFLALESGENHKIEILIKSEATL